MRIGYEQILRRLGFNKAKVVPTMSLNTVFEAQRAYDNQRFAVKMPKQGTNSELYTNQVEHLEKEARVLEIARGLEGIAPLTSFHVLGIGGRRIPVLTRRFIDGKTLQETEKLRDERAKINLCAAVGELHDAGFVNLDIKPENIIVPDDPNKYPQFLDIGGTSYTRAQLFPELWGEYRKEDLIRLAKLFN